MVVAYAAGCLAASPQALPVLEPADAAPREASLVVPELRGDLLLLDPATGEERSRLPHTALSPRCDEGFACDVLGVEQGPAHLWITWARREPISPLPGGVARWQWELVDGVPAAGAVDRSWEVGRFPHDLVVLGDGSLIVADGLNNRLVRLDPDTGETLGELDPLWSGWGDGELPNGLQRVPDPERVLVLVTFRGRIDVLPIDGDGSLLLIDLTAPEAPQAVWRYPTEGWLATPHAGAIVTVEGVPWLVYAHSTALPDGGTVGVASFDGGPVTPPTYRADLVLPEKLAFPRGVAVGVDAAGGAALLVTDSGPDPAADDVADEGVIWTLPWPELPATTASGLPDDLALVEVGAMALRRGLALPFEAWPYGP